ncbi:MAG TPA: ATP12 family protein [Xanthobacteraceae bacterium]|nr:ATP12 family protein [Xanthobacteraceae bacterium]
MRELFDMERAPDPMRAARGTKRALPKRFYKEASVGATPGGHALLLDGKPVKTPARLPLTLPTWALAEAVCAEWAAQESRIDPARMPMTRLANLAIDRGAESAGALAEEIAGYAGSDLLLYRAGQPEGLVAMQAAHWDPILAWTGEALGARFVLAEGLRFVAQPEAALAAVRAAVAAEAPPFRLAALASLTTLSGSALIALALSRRALDAGAAWAAAHVDEDWNIRQCGADAEATARRAARRAEFDAAARMLALA